jgi:hypothetical protein
MITVSFALTLPNGFGIILTGVVIVAGEDGQELSDGCRSAGQRFHAPAEKYRPAIDIL